MNSTPSQRIGQLLRRARRDAGLTQQQLAAHLGCAQATVSAWEAGTYEPSIGALIQLSDILDVPSGAWIEAGKEPA